MRMTIAATVLGMELNRTSSLMLVISENLLLVGHLYRSGQMITVKIGGMAQTILLKIHKNLKSFFQWKSCWPTLSCKRPWPIVESHMSYTWHWDREQDIYPVGRWSDQLRMTVCKMWRRPLRSCKYPRTNVPMLVIHSPVYLLTNLKHKLRL